MTDLYQPAPPRASWLTIIADIIGGLLVIALCAFAFFWIGVLTYKTDNNHHIRVRLVTERRP